LYGLKRQQKLNEAFRIMREQVEGEISLDYRYTLST